VGYTIALPGMERAFNCLRWSPYGLGGSRDLRDRVVPERIQPEPTAFEAAEADGVEVTLVGAGEEAPPGVTPAGPRRTGHVPGGPSGAWRMELAHVDRLAGQIAERLPGDAALFVTGDHGMVDLRPGQLVDLAERPGLAHGGRLVGG